MCTICEFTWGTESIELIIYEKQTETNAFHRAAERVVKINPANFSCLSAPLNNKPDLV